MKSVIPQYKPPNPLGGPCEHCGAAVKDLKQCPKDLQIRLDMATGKLDPYVALPEKYCGPNCTTDFAGPIIDRIDRHYKLIDFYWAIVAITFAVGYLVGRYH